jgi:3-oxoadipate enol-lactonase
MPRLAVAVDGTELHYEERGAGPPIVFAHGLLWSGRMFDAQVAALADRFRCITFDLRNQGQSPSSPSPFDMETLTADAATLIEKLGAAPCHFVGLSMGGFIGMRLAARRPELVRSLTLIETAADGEPWLNVPKYRAMVFIARRFGLGPLTPSVMRIMFGRAFLRDPARTTLRAKMADELRALDIARLEPALEAVLRRRPISAELARIAVPTLVLHGEGDRAIVPPRARRMAAAIAGAKLVMVPRAGHTSTVEEPDAITRELRAFVESR